MGFYKKTIILSNQQAYGKGMAILTIEQNNSGVFGNLKAFDLPSVENLMLGISLDGVEVIKQNVVLLNNNTYNFKLQPDFQINGKISCVLVSLENMQVVPLVWGTNGTHAEYKKDIIKIIEKQTIIQQDVASSIQSASAMQNNENTENLAPIDEKEQEDLFESSDEEIEQIIDENLQENDNFFSLVQEQLDELFLKYLPFEEMQQYFPDSKWVKVDYNNDGYEYIIGIINENGTAKYICYGVPGQFEVNPPDDLLDYSQFVPVEDGGYWVMFQDANTGESVKVG